MKSVIAYTAPPQRTFVSADEQISSSTMTMKGFKGMGRVTDTGFRFASEYRILATIDGYGQGTVLTSMKVNWLTSFTPGNNAPRFSETIINNEAVPPAQFAYDFLPASYTVTNYMAATVSADRPYTSPGDFQINVDHAGIIFALSGSMPVSPIYSTNVADLYATVLYDVESWKGTNGAENRGGTRYEDVVELLGGNDTFRGLEGNDVIWGNPGNDRLYGNQGNDKLIGGLGYDTLDGGIGDDSLWGDNGNDLLIGNDGKDVLQGGNGKDRLIAGAGDDKLYGGADNDRLVGGTGKDLLHGGYGADTLVGGAGADLFVFHKPGESVPGRADYIEDFQRGLDKIDLRQIDANSNVSGNQAFGFNGTTAGNYKIWTAGDGDDLLVRGDVNGDGRADFQIRLDDLDRLSSSDFLL